MYRYTTFCGSMLLQGLTATSLLVGYAMSSGFIVTLFSRICRLVTILSLLMILWAKHSVGASSAAVRSHASSNYFSNPHFLPVFVAFACFVS
jgi:hypothetical protein